MVRIEGLSLAYSSGKARVIAVEGAELELPRGRITALLGPSGCGKTSIVQALAGLLQPEAGEICIEGKPLAGVRDKTAVIFQDYGLLPWKTVEGNAELPLLLRGLDAGARKSRVAPLLEELGLAEFKDFYPNRLSGGMKQRLAIARALASEPDILLMDEPFSSLDALTRESLQESLLEVSARHGITVLIVTHSIEEAVYLADRIYVMRGRLPGKIVERIDLPEKNLKSAGAVSNRFRDSELYHTISSRLRASVAEGRIERSGFLLEDGAGQARKRSELLRRAIAGSAALALLLVVWLISAEALGKPFLPHPQLAVERFFERCLDGSLLRHVLASARRIGLAILLIGPPAGLLGMAAGLLKRLDSFVSPLIYLFYPLPKIAFLPLIMLLLGLGDASKIGVIVLIVASQVLVNARDAARAVPEALIDSAKALGAGAMARFWHVLLPSALPALLSALRVSLGTATAVLFFAETFATEEGLGWYIMDAWARVDYPDMYAAIIALSIFGILCFALVDAVEALLCRWRTK